MANNLREFLQQNKCQGFQPIPRYHEAGDFLSYFFQDVPCHAKSIDRNLTVFLADDTKALVGCKIYGVKHIVTRAAQFGILDQTNHISFGLFLFAGVATATDPAQRRWYDELRTYAGDEIALALPVPAVSA